MLLLAALPAGILAGLLRGGSLRQLSQAKFRLSWLLPLAFILQLMLFPLSYESNEGVIPSGYVPWLYPLSYFFLLLGCAVNRRLAGMKVLGFGIALNVLVIVANGGYMPAGAEAWEQAGMPQADSGAVHNNLLEGEGARLVWLGDVIAPPSWLPGGGVYSLGDIFVALGGLFLVQGLMLGPAAIAYRGRHRAYSGRKFQLERV